jgi:SOS response regulatory protein OraA/RecX
VAGLFDPGVEARFAKAVLEKWERAKGAADDTARRHAAYAHLRRRGFSSAVSRAVLFNRAEIE